MLIGIDASRAAKKIKTGTEWYSFFLIEELKKITGVHSVILYSREPLEGALGIMPANWENRVLKWPLKYLWTQIRLSMEMFFNPPDVLFIPAHSLPLIHPKNSVVTWHDIGFERFKHLYAKATYWYHKWAVRFSLKHARKIIVISKFTRDEILEVFGDSAAPQSSLRDCGGTGGSELDIFDHRRQLPPIRRTSELSPANLENKTSVVCNGYDNRKYRADLDKNKINEVLKKYNIRDPYIFFIGRLEQKKNIAGLVEAFRMLKKEHPLYQRGSSRSTAGRGDFSTAQLIRSSYTIGRALSHGKIPPGSPLKKGGDELKLVLAGRRGYGFDKVEKNIEKYGIRDDIAELGWTDENDIPYLFAGSSIFAFLSFYEGFGIPVLEAMACGAPVIASDIPSLREVADDAAIFVNPNSPKEIAGNIAKILESEDLREKMVNRGLERVKNFSWKKCARETLEEIKKLRY